MKEEILKINHLLERFYDGLTSNEEEKELYSFFGRDDIPDELIPHKPVIQYFATGLADEIFADKDAETQTPEMPEMSETPETTEMPETTESPKPSEPSETQTFVSLQQRTRKKWLYWSSVAASVLIVLFSSIYYLATNDSFDSYEGSYIIRNGVRITDLNLIRPELEAAIQKSLLLEQEADRLIERLSMIDDTQELQIMQQMQKHNQRILDNTEDATVRNEIEEILTPNI